MLNLQLARNLKFYPLVLHQAINEGKLQFIKDKFEVETWDLLNLKPKTVLDLPSLLYEQYDISSDFLKDALDSYNI